MSNDNSKEIKDTRGRPRSSDTDDASDKIYEAYMKNKLPIVLKSGEPKRFAKRLRLSTSLTDIQNELGVKIRLLPQSDGVLACLRKGG